MIDAQITNVLITAMGCNTAISVAKGLRLSKDRQYKIIGVDMAPEFEAAGSVFCDDFYQVSAFSDSSYIDELLRIAINKQVQAIMSVVDREVAVLAAHEAVFKKNGITLCLPSLEVTSVCNDKYETNSYLEKKGIAVPSTFLKNEIASPDFDLDYPLFVRPRHGVSSSDCYVVNSLDELTLCIDRIDEPIIQKLIKGEQYVIDIINDIDGNNIISIPRHEISAKAGIGVKAVTINDHELSLYGKTVAEALGLQGVANIEIFKNESGISFIEINPRFSAGSILSVVAGVNLPAIVVDLFLGRDISSFNLKHREGVYMSRYWKETFSEHKVMLDKFNFEDYHGK